MNVLMLLAIVPLQFQGAWCDTKGNHEYVITQNQIAIQSDYVCNLKSVNINHFKLQADYLDCADMSELKTFTKMSVNLRMTYDRGKLHEWYTDKTGRVHNAAKTLVKCEKPND